MIKQQTKLRLSVRPEPIDYQAKSWYTDATVLIKSFYGDNWKLFIGLLASTSPRTAVKKNWNLANKILSAYLNRDSKPEKFADILGRLMPSHLVNVIRTLQGRPIKGPKVSRFYANLCGDLSVVTVDMWICKAYNIGHSKLTEKVYQAIERRMIADAKRQGMNPASWQAVIWYAVRRLAGKNPKSFVSVYWTLASQTKLFDFMYEE